MGTHLAIPVSAKIATTNKALCTHKRILVCCKSGCWANEKDILFSLLWRFHLLLLLQSHAVIIVIYSSRKKTIIWQTQGVPQSVYTHFE